LLGLSAAIIVALAGGLLAKGIAWWQGHKVRRNG
jgi:hypothetical protein